MPECRNCGGEAPENSDICPDCLELSAVNGLSDQNGEAPVGNEANPGDRPESTESTDDGDEPVIESTGDAPAERAGENPDEAVTEPEDESEREKEQNSDVICQDEERKRRLRSITEAYIEAAPSSSEVMHTDEKPEAIDAQTVTETATFACTDETDDADDTATFDISGKDDGIPEVEAADERSTTAENTDKPEASDSSLSGETDKNGRVRIFFKVFSGAFSNLTRVARGLIGTVSRAARRAWRYLAGEPFDKGIYGGGDTAGITVLSCVSYIPLLFPMPVILRPGSRFLRYHAACGAFFTALAGAIELFCVFVCRIIKRLCTVRVNAGTSFEHIEVAHTSVVAASVIYCISTALIVIIFLYFVVLAVFGRKNRFVPGFIKKLSEADIGSDGGQSGRDDKSPEQEKKD